MLTISQKKMDAMNRLSNEDGVISALALDQRGSLQKMIAKYNDKADDTSIVLFKELVTSELTPYASSILLDPEFGLPAAQTRAKNAGLLLAYEKTGYDATAVGRLPDLLDEWSVHRLAEAGADSVKFLLYYDADEDAHINEYKHVYMERVGYEAEAADLPFFLEIVTYDATNADVSTPAYAKAKPHKVLEAMREFSKPQYKVDVLKVEVPVNMKYVAGFGDEAVYSQQVAMDYFKEQSDCTHLPFIFLSAGVSAELFRQTLHFAKQAGCKFNGVLCGRATWKDGVQPFAEQGEDACRQWLRTQGRKNIEELDVALRQTAVSWHDKVQLKA